MDDDDAGQANPAYDRKDRSNHELDCPDSWGGSQYDHQDGAVDDDKSSTDQDAESAPEGEGDNDNDMVHMSSMRIHMNAMQITEDIEEVPLPLNITTNTIYYQASL